MDITSYVQELLSHWAGISTALATIVGVVFGFFKWVKPHIRLQQRVNDWISNLDISKRFTSAEKTIAEMKNRIDMEFAPNHGSSLRDAIDRIEHSVAFFQTFNDVISNRINLAYFAIDVHGHGTYASKSLLELLEGHPSEFLSLGWKNFIREDESVDFFDSLMRAVWDKREYRTEVNLVTSDLRNKISVECHAYPFFNKKKELLGYIVLFTQIGSPSSSVGSTGRD